MLYRFIIYTLVYTFFIHSINAQPFQEKDAVFQNQSDFIATIQREMRIPAYIREILPNDFSHLDHLLSFGLRTNQSPIFLKSVIKSFNNMLKRSQYVNANAFSELLDNLPQQLLPYFSLPASRTYISDSALYDAAFMDRFNATVNSMLYAQFSTHYESFRQDPAAFLRTVSANIVTVAQEELIQEQLRQSIIRFSECALSKLVWDPADQEKTWMTTKRIAEQLAHLLEHNILDDTSDLDDLYLTLLNRYCYFIEITATDMPSTFFAAIKNDITSSHSVLFAIDEQDAILGSKMAYMQRTLIEAETAAYRYQAGLPRG